MHKAGFLGHLLNQLWNGKCVKITYIYGSLLFVTSEDPNLDAGSLEVGNGLRDTVLQFVFDGRGT